MNGYRRRVMEYYSTIKMSEVMPFSAAWIELEIIIPSEVSHIQKDKYHMIITYMQKKMIQMNLFTKQKQTDKTNLGLLKGKQGEKG